MKKLLAMVLTVIMVLGMAACAYAEEPIKIGLSYMETGEFALSGELMLKGVLLAAEEINAKGGILGRQVEIVEVDNASTAQGAVTSVNKILSDDVVACIGPTTSGMVNSTLQYYNEAGIPFVSAATSPKIRDNEAETFFRISVSDALVGTVMVKFAAESLGATKIGIIHNTDDYGMAAMNAAVEAAPAYGIETYTEGMTSADTDDYGMAAMNAAVEAAPAYGIETYTEGMTSADTDVSAQLLKIKNWGADCIFSFTHDQDTVLVVRQLFELGMHDINYVGPNALPMPANIPLIEAEALEGCYAATDYFADTTDEVLQAYITRYAERWDGLEVDRLAALYYTSAYVIFDAIERAGSTEPAAIMAAMAETAGLETVLGPITSDANHDLNSTLFIVQFDAEKNCSLVEKVTLN